MQILQDLILNFLSKMDSTVAILIIFSLATIQGYHDEGSPPSSLSSRDNQRERDIWEPADKLIPRHGYPVQVHRVTTQDGYILTLHRIPWGRNRNRNQTESSTRFPVLIMHGFMHTADNWLVLTRDYALPYLLADNGFDVWLGNYRGGHYSRRHASLDSNSLKFWKFSYDEVANFDVPKMIDHVLQESNQSKLDYIGHALGAGTFFGALALHPEYNAKVRKMVACAPAPYITGAETSVTLGKFLPDAMFLAPFDAFYNGELLNLSGKTKFLLDSLNSLLGPVISHTILSSFMFGINEEQESVDTEARIMGHSPAPTSARIAVHLAQSMRSSCFCRYDYGRKKNLRRYGRKSPPAYDLHKVTVPVYGLYGLEDKVVRPKDALRTLKEIENCVNIDTAAVTDRHWGHLDFLDSKSAKRLAYDRALHFLQHWEISKTL